MSDWLASNHTAAGTDTVEKGNAQLENHCPRQRTWSARTFHDFLAPIPQLQKKWCSWTTNSPFTKLADNSVSLAKRGEHGSWGLSPSTPHCLLMGHVFPLIYCFVSPTCNVMHTAVHLAWCTANSFAYLFCNLFRLFWSAKKLYFPAVNTCLRNNPQSRKTF